MSGRRGSARRRFALLMIAALAAGGCAADPWQDYDTSLYRRLKENDREAVNDHLVLLKEIIDRAEDHGERPPPGVSAEYGYGLAMGGNIESGMLFLDRETATYPESATFVLVLKRVIAGDAKVLEPAPKPAHTGAQP